MLVHHEHFGLGVRRKGEPPRWSIHTFIDVSFMEHTQLKKIINCLPHIIFQLLYNIIMFETEVHNISIIVRSVGSIIVCASCMFGIPQQSWAGNKFVAAVLVAAHQYFFALSLPGNITQKRCPAWDAALNGRLCSNRNPVKSTSVFVTLSNVLGCLK